MYRNELKFFINAHQKVLLENKLREICQRDLYSNPDGGYLVTSLYFDDYHQSALMDKLGGVLNRKKYRVRVYNNQPNVIKLEKKIKRNIVTEKTHLQISRHDYDSLIRSNAGFLKDKEDKLAREFYLAYQTRNLRPRVVVEYRREAFMYKYGDVRVTFDSMLKAGIFAKDLFANGYMIPAMPPNQIILEVKYTGYFPDIIRNIIRSDNLQWQACSKYVQCCVVGM